MKRMKNLAGALALALALAVGLAGCAGSNGSNGAKTDGASSSAEYYTDGDYGFEYEMPQEAVNESKGTAGQADTTLPQKLVYTADVTLETRDLNAALTAVDARLKALGGTVQDSTLEGLNPAAGEDDTVSYAYSAGRPRATLTIRVPSEKFNEFLAGLQAEQELFTVRQVASRTENLTRQYYDQESRVKALRAEEEWLLEAMAKAENVSELLEIRDRLTQVRWEIESLTNSLQTIDYDADWSTVELTVTQVERYSPKEEAGFGERIGRYFADSGAGFMEFLEGALRVLILALPYLVILGIVIAVVVAGVKHSGKKRAQKMAAYGQPPAPPAETQGPEEKK